VGWQALRMPPRQVMVVAAASDVSRVSVRDLIDFVDAWIAQHTASGIELGICTEPANDDDDDYSVACEVRFEPVRKSCARLELWLTKDGAIAVGFETKKRVSELSGIDCGNAGFASGSEPMEKLGLGGVNALLNVVADGELKVAIKPRLFSGPRIAAVTSAGTREWLRQASQGALSWIRDEAAFRNRGRILKFEPWNIPPAFDGKR
jgi:hypothetical protein